jgi:hypothetical protein
MDLSLFHIPIAPKGAMGIWERYQPIVKITGEKKKRKEGEREKGKNAPYGSNEYKNGQANKGETNGGPTLKTTSYFLYQRKLKKT